MKFWPRAKSWTATRHMTQQGSAEPRGSAISDFAEDPLGLRLFSPTQHRYRRLSCYGDPVL